MVYAFGGLQLGQQLTAAARIAKQQAVGQIQFAFASSLAHQLRPGGVAFLITALTDNTNRTIANIRHILSKNGGKLAESGSVAFQFEKKGIITLAENSEETELAAIEAGAEETEAADEFLIVKTEPQKLMAARQSLLDKNLKVKSAELAFKPVNEMKIENAETARKILKLVDALEEDEDIDFVAGNFDIPEEFLGK